MDSTTEHWRLLTATDSHVVPLRVLWMHANDLLVELEKARLLDVGRGLRLVRTNQLSDLSNEITRTFAAFRKAIQDAVPTHVCTGCDGKGCETCGYIGYDWKRT